MARISGHPIEFSSAADQIRGAQLRSELHTREIPAPGHVAPNSVAFAAGISRGPAQNADATVWRGRSGTNTAPAATINQPAAHEDSALDEQYGAGRLILLHDPAAADEWGGDFRIVCFAQAPLEVEIGVDPFISDVAWSWLVDALELRGAGYTYLSGTATKTLSSGFGTLKEQGDAAQIELRASWTPLGDDFAAHAEAWSELLCLLAGLPHHEGVDSISARRARQSLPGA